MEEIDELRFESITTTEVDADQCSPQRWKTNSGGGVDLVQSRNRHKIKR